MSKFAAFARVMAMQRSYELRGILALSQSSLLNAVHGVNRDRQGAVGSSATAALLTSDTLRHKGRYGVLNPKHDQIHVPKLSVNHL